MRSSSLSLVLMLAAPAAAQFENPQEKIREIAEEVAQQMQEIDRLLLQGGGRGLERAAEEMGKTAERVDELLRRTSTSQQGVVKKLDDLIQEIERLQGQSSSGQSSGSPQQRRPGEEERQRQSSQRERTPPPEMTSQQRQGEEQPQENRPEPQTAGENQPAEQQPKDATERVDKGRDTERWGVLPGYEEMFKVRGGTPKVPEKYRTFLEAFQKQGQGSGERR